MIPLLVFDLREWCKLCTLNVELVIWLDASISIATVSLASSKSESSFAVPLLLPSTLIQLKVVVAGVFQREIRLS